jgi:hypothetical protein
MKVRTHMNLGKLILLKNSHKLPEGFSTFMFNFGLIMVDQSWLVKTHPHFAQKSLSYIQNKIKSLLLNTKFNAYSSMQLGVVIHYLCDFCCFVHKDGTIGNINEHLKYERNLQKHLLNNFSKLKEKYVHKYCNHNILSSNLSEINNFINTKLLKYRQGDMSYDWDIENCIELSSTVCSLILSLNKENISQNIAIYHSKNTIANILN